MKLSLPAITNLILEEIKEIYYYDVTELIQDVGSQNGFTAIEGPDSVYDGFYDSDYDIVENESKVIVSSNLLHLEFSDKAFFIFRDSIKRCISGLHPSVTGCETKTLEYENDVVFVFDLFLSVDSMAAAYKVMGEILIENPSIDPPKVLNKASIYCLNWVFETTNSCIKRVKS